MHDNTHPEFWLLWGMQEKKQQRVRICSIACQLYMAVPWGQERAERVDLESGFHTTNALLRTQQVQSLPQGVFGPCRNQCFLFFIFFLTMTSGILAGASLFVLNNQVMAP